MALQRSSSSLDETASWSESRIRVRSLLVAQSFDLGLTLVILFNLLLVVLETDASVEADDTPAWILQANHVLLGIYSAELVMRLYVYRWVFFSTFWNLLDLVVVVADLALLLASFTIGDMPSVSVLRVLRLARLARSYKVLVMFPELFLMVRGFAGALRSVFWGMCLIFFAVLVFAILAVNLLHEINIEVYESGAYGDCTRCARAFEGVFQASLTLVQQVVAGDSWGTVTIPIVEYAPWTGLFFMLVFVTKSLLIMNLILGMIVDAASEARKGSDSELARAREKDRAEARKKLLSMCADLDTEHSGRLTLENLIRGYDDNPEFADVLQSMDIMKPDMETVYDILDEDKNGYVIYEEFANQIHKMKTSDSHTMLVFIKHYVLEIKKRLSQQLKAVEADIYETIQNTVSQNNQSRELDFAGLDASATQRRWVGSPTQTQRSSLLAGLLHPQRTADEPDAEVTASAELQAEMSAEVAALHEVRDELVRGLKDLSEASGHANGRLLDVLQRVAEHLGVVDRAAGREADAGCDPFGKFRQHTGRWCSGPGRGTDGKQRLIVPPASCDGDT